MSAERFYVLDNALVKLLCTGDKHHEYSVMITSIFEYTEVIFIQKFAKKSAKFEKIQFLRDE